MKILSLKIENFKGIRSQEIDFNGNDTIISAENGRGKTSIYDSFLWLLFGKDSQGKSDFEIRPLDKNNKPDNNCIIKVTAEIDVDGTKHQLVKQNKKTSNGFSNSFWINEVPKKAGEFADFIDSVIGNEDKFKLVSFLQQFNTIHWQDRRNILLELAGDIAKPEGFDALINAMAGRTLDEYKKVVTDRKKLKTKERDEINPRIDELLSQINDSSMSDGLMSHDEEREFLEGEMATIDSEYQRIEQENAQRAKIVEQVSQLKNKQTALATQIQSDKSHVATYSEEIGKKRQAISAMETDLKAIEEKGKQIALSLNNKKSELALATSEINRLRAERDRVKAEMETISLQTIETNCYACGAILKPDKLTENQNARQKALNEKQNRYNDIVKLGKEQQAHIKKLTDELKAIETDYQAAKTEYTEQKSICDEVKGIAQKEIARLELQIANAGTTDFTQNIDWQALNKQIEAIKVPELQTTEHLISERKEIQAKLDECNKALAQKDNIDKAQKRIGELKQHETNLGIEITKLDGELQSIADYKEQESNMIIQAVNGQFEKVTFKLFDTLVNGDLKPCCETLYEGVPYSAMSTGQKIIAGIDIINRLSVWYNMDVPLFIDNAESLTIPYNRTGQTIELIVSNKKKLTVETR